MTLTDVRLSFLAFPQMWKPNSLQVNLLLLPNADPLAPLTPAQPMFAGTALHLETVLVIGLDALPAPSSPNTQTTPLVVTPPADALSLFQKFQKDQGPTSPPLNSLAGVRILKSLPDSYTSAFPFEQSRTPFANPAEDFGCTLRAKDPGNPKTPPPPQTWSWGKFISFALRQPRFAQELGLLYPLTLPLDPGAVKNGSWIYFRVDSSNPANPYANAPTDTLKSYAARLPALAGSARPLFAASLFPVVDAIPNESEYDDVQIEAETYDDGFAKIVHVHQPVSTDAAIEDRNQVKPGTDAGIQIGWDDEQVTIWYNRSLKTALSTQTSVPDAIESPLGALGYCVDVRETGDANWHSLCQGSATITYGAFTANVKRDYGVEPVPVRSAVAGDVTSWLPRYFAQWRGKSLIVNDLDAYQLGGGAAPTTPPAVTPELPPVQLLYGHDYEFRTRLLDLTGGTPDPGLSTVNPGPALSATCAFRRYLLPKSVTFPTNRANAPEPIDSLSFARPIFGYPEFQFAGITDEAVVKKLIAQIPPPGTIKILGVPDPDVDKFQLAVEVRTPAHDVGNPGDLDGPWRHVYFVERSFNPYPVEDPVGGDAPVTVEFDYQDIPHISKLATIKPDLKGKLPLPRARDIRIVITPLGRAADNYWNDDTTRFGMTSTFTTRAEATNEGNLLGTPGNQPPDQIRAILLQPQNNLTLNLAQELRLDVNELTFKGQSGTRTVFGCSKALRHDLAPDKSTITFAAEGELLNKWIVVAEFDIDRDWTWDGLADYGVEVARDGKLVGTLEVRPTLSQIAIGNGIDTGPLADPTVRERTHLIFFDAVDATPRTYGFSVNQAPKWQFTPLLRGSPSAANLVQNLEIVLPVTVPPRQTPKLASAGIALSPYTIEANYAATGPRRRALWLEFTEPVADQHDTIFARVLAYGADPLMVRGLGYDLANPDEPDLPIDPEQIRVITPLSSHDNAGLSAMVELIKSPTSDVHYMLPLPPGISEEDLELFGFWTYEFRIGHRSIFDRPVAGLWSTARARFGRPLRVTGVQHPAPTLVCYPSHRFGKVKVVAPFATPVLLNGKSLVDPQEGKPRTRIWIMLYAQVKQVDGKSWRNVLINHRHAETVGAVEDEHTEVTVRPSRDVFGHATFNDEQIQATLHRLSLAPNTPLSVLAVELLPPRADQLRDEMGQNLGQVRILRTSSLTPVPQAC
ncbi:hypothetical protein [Mycobacterium sp. OTB74]|uniref:hypothetical protein n=1 Tax=Mycobacterium sp. OTB74 TaxID=1853452 RepID=UPI0024764508|nr:hypothetical protein [Mycobacterium sp. OTB74]MDH6247768.1 hypothetical protein [Mycobacterium sp. OTB74]